MYGTSGGLTTSGGQLLTQDSPGEPGTSAFQDRFGATLTAAEWGFGSGEDELAVGVPFDDAAGQDAGAVNLFAGSPTGLTVASPLVTSSQPQAGARWSSALAGAAFGSVPGSQPILAVGAPFQDVRTSSGAGAAADAGLVEVIYETPDTVFDSGRTRLTQVQLSDNPEPGDRLGSSLAFGDFDGSGRKDLAIGVPFEVLTFGGQPVVDTGAVHVVYPDPNTGLLTVPDQFFSPSIHSGDEFGAALSAWNFGKGPETDLAVGAPFASPFFTNDPNVTQFDRNGSIGVFYGSPIRLEPGGALFTQGAQGILGDPEDDDHFGATLY
jgi:hypothetical protein